MHLHPMPTRVRTAHHLLVPLRMRMLARTAHSNLPAVRMHLRRVRRAVWRLRRAVLPRLQLRPRPRHLPSLPLLQDQSTVCLFVP